MLTGGPMPQRNHEFLAQLHSILDCQGTSLHCAARNKKRAEISTDLNNLSACLRTFAFCDDIPERLQPDEARKKIQLVDVVLSRLSVTDQEALAFAAICGDRDCTVASAACHW